MLLPSEKRWIREMIRKEFRKVINEMTVEEKTAHGGYDGATPVVDDDWAEESRRRIGFTTITIPATGAPVQAH